MTFLTFSVKMTLNTRGYNSVWSPEGFFSRAAAASYIASMFVASLYVRKVAPLSVKNWQKVVTTWDGDSSGKRNWAGFENPKWGQRNREGEE